MKSLPRATELVKSSWSFFISTWSESVKVSIWFVYIGLLQFALLGLIKISPDGADALYLMISLFSILAIVLWVWTVIRTVQTMLRLDAGKKIDLSRESKIRAWKEFLPLVWIAVLQMLILLGACFPLIVWKFSYLFFGMARVSPQIFLFVTALLSIPLVWVGVQLGFTLPVAVDTDERGMRALETSRTLVEGRWGQVFGRALIGLVVFGGLLWIVLTLMIFFISAIIGPDMLIAIASNPYDVDPLIEGAITLLKSIVQAAMFPLFVGFHVKLYRALQRTR